jgi:hypothetical protein
LLADDHRRLRMLGAETFEAVDRFVVIYDRHTECVWKLPMIQGVFKISQ